MESGISLRFYNERRVWRDALAQVRSWPRSTINVLAMAHLQHHHRDPLVLDIADQAIVADPVAPEPAFFALEGPSPLPGVLRLRESLSQKTDDCLLSLDDGVL